MEEDREREREAETGGRRYVVRGRRVGVMNNRIVQARGRK